VTLISGVGTLGVGTISIAGGSGTISTIGASSSITAFMVSTYGSCGTATF